MDFQVLSSFDKYKNELASGNLDWTPMHTSDQFWKENVERFADRDYLVLRSLLKVLETNREVRASHMASGQAQLRQSWQTRAVPVYALAQSPCASSLHGPEALCVACLVRNLDL